MFSVRTNPFVQTIVVLFAAGLVFATFSAMKLGGSLAFFAMLLAIAVSAIRHRSGGWVLGLLFVALILTLPLWTLGSFKLCDYLGLLK